MKQIFVFAILLFANISFGQVTDSNFGKPILWYRVSDPWAMFMGAEGPPFILYDNGKVLHWKSGSYYLVQLSEFEKAEIINELHLKDTLFQKNRFINATSSTGEIMATDNPTYSVFVNFDTVNRVSVYGYISSSEYRKRFPKQLLTIHDFVMNFAVERQIHWIPDKIEVMLSDYSHSPDTPIQWPLNWSDLSSSDTRQQNGYVTSIFIDKKYLSQLIKLIKKRREKQAFEINGKKYFIGYRFPIPGLY